MDNIIVIIDMVLSPAYIIYQYEGLVSGVFGSCTILNQEW